MSAARDDGRDVRRALRAWIGRAVAAAVGRLLPWIMGRALRRGLRGVWCLGPEPELPPGGFVLAANHHSWWDGYVAWLATRRMRRPAAALMDPAQLERFPFFRHAGVLASTEVRAAVRALEAGRVLLVFPEGALRAAGGTGTLEPGAAYLARTARVPVVPMAMRVVLRGAPRPEAYVAFAPAVAPGPDATRELRAGLDARLAALDAALARSHPEDVPPAAVLWLAGRAGTRDGRAWWERLWSR